MARNHNHGHHGHEHGAGDYNRAFAIGIALNVSFVIVEAVYGVLAHSVALLADAGHNASDVLSLILAWGASLLSRRPPNHANIDCCGNKPQCNLLYGLWTKQTTPCGNCNAIYRNQNQRAFQRA